MENKITLESIKLGDVILDKDGNKHEITPEKLNQLNEYKQQTGKSPIWAEKITGVFINHKWHKDKRDKKELDEKEFIEFLLRRSKEIGFKVGNRDWCYELEGNNIIDKSQFKKAGDDISKYRKDGRLPIDFTAEDMERQFYNVEPLQIDYIDPKEFIYNQVKDVKKLYRNKNDISFWDYQKYYPQLITEKKSIVDLFKDICEYFHIPIANAKGRSDINQRNLMAKRYKEAEKKGLIPILIYYPDHDPAGLKIVDDMMDNFRQIENQTGWKPDNLKIYPVGLTYEFIEHNKLMWIDNLISGGKRNIGKIYEAWKEGAIINTSKKNRLYKYEIEYIVKYGAKKCEVNAMLPISKIARKDLIDTIFKFIDTDGINEYRKQLNMNKKEVRDIMKAVNFRKRINKLLRDVLELDLK